MPLNHSHDTHPGHGPGHGSGHDGDLIEILDLDAVVLAEHLADIIRWLPFDAPPRRIVDLGCGTGAGTFALLERLPDAHVIAVDSSVAHLQRLMSKACERGEEHRVRTVQADLDGPTWPDLGRPDLVWASASLHHLADPERALRAVGSLLAPGGLFAVLELAGFPRFLPENMPTDRPGLEDRCHAAADRLHAGRMSHRGADWGPLLTAAGFTVEGIRTIAVNVEGAGDHAVGAYALNGLTRIRHGLADALDPEDLAALDRLLDTGGDQSILRRGDLQVRTERTIWAARRPG
ncbi:class I SAM-dependent methyltransferase [Solwaraspora sp. WMMD1047]|uniref:class I SAM-dependent methyltransferase n=1 Tax=Solwaraspora sp. WMMD1047 TaxID=3016102 RepID=UPI002416AB5D|nr:class I SAM-dependent methyltransferase [Solwaraspora sp. WMMD1047]MDG4828763.1 class I SAM-dependent methyltransferase [Solwaraspora sp. WMMD1047]